MTKPPSENMGGGFVHHGVATPVSNHRGIVATTDAQGNDVVLIWLFDHRGGYALLLIDVETGAAEEYPMPFPPGGDCPFSSILSSGNRFYTHFNSHFTEFDPVQREFTFSHATVPQMAMGMTEDDQGHIWSVTYPNSSVAMFNPETREFNDYGPIYDQNWRQYQRYVAADDSGWIYFGIGNTASQLIAFDPDSTNTRALLSDTERGTGTGYVYRDKNGKVYGLALAGEESNGWYELYRGEARKVSTAPSQQTPIITSSQGLFYKNFPSGRQIETCDLVERRLVVSDAGSGERLEHSFDYRSEGAHIMGLATASNNSICGGTAFPMRFFSFDPIADKWDNRASYRQWNTVTSLGNLFFVGGYTGGFLLEWDPSQTWVSTEIDYSASNPRFLDQCAPTINRPHCLLAHPDGRRVIVGGTPGYGYTGGGLMIWDRQLTESVVLSHTDLLPNQSTMSLAALDDGRQLLGGSTTSPGTGGEKKADVAELYLFDLETRKITWHEAMLPEVQEYTALHPADGGNVYGFADRSIFFVFDPNNRRIIHRRDTSRTCSHQGPRVFVRGIDTTYVLFEEHIGRIEPTDFSVVEIAHCPVPISAGGDFLNGRIYFAGGSHLYSYEV